MGRVRVETDMQGVGEVHSEMHSSVKMRHHKTPNVCEDAEWNSQPLLVGYKMLL